MAKNAFGGQPARTVTYDWAVGGNPLRSSVADPAGTITTTVDLLGRTLSYTDAANDTTTSAYDQPGRPPAHLNGVEDVFKALLPVLLARSAGARDGFAQENGRGLPQEDPDGADR